MCNNYIVVEGLEGAGKTTARNVITNVLNEHNIQKIIFTREPGGTKLTEGIRNLILDVKLTDDEIINDKTEILMFYAARVQIVETVIKPALKKGFWVIGDRHDLSTQAYQGGGRGIDRKIIDILRDTLLGDFRPSYTIYLDVMPEVGLKRVYSRNYINRIEKESLDFFKRVRASYLELASRDESIKIIDANKPLTNVINEIRKILNQLFWNK